MKSCIFRELWIFILQLICVLQIYWLGKNILPRPSGALRLCAVNLFLSQGCVLPSSFRVPGDRGFENKYSGNQNPLPPCNDPFNLVNLMIPPTVIVCIKEFAFKVCHRNKWPSWSMSIDISSDILICRFAGLMSKATQTTQSPSALSP